MAKAIDWRTELARALQHAPPFGVLEIAFDQATAEQAWRENVPSDSVARDGEPFEPGRYGSLDDVDFATQAVVVWSSGESGWCPEWLSDVATERKRVRLTVTANGDSCTDAYNHYRMVLAVDRSKLPVRRNLPTIRVTVPGSQATGYAVTAYPAKASLVRDW